MSDSVGARPDGPGSHAPHEARAGLRPAGFDPSRDLRIEFHQHDWIEGFAAFASGATTPAPNSTAFCVLNVGSFLAAVEIGDLKRSDLPYLVAESMMHEVIHVLEQWARVEFSEERVEALLERYRDSDRHPEGGDAEQAPSRSDESAVPEAIAQTQSGEAA